MSVLSAALPDGVVPLFLSSKTQELFGVHADIDVTAENPMKIVSKEQVLQDLYNRAAISDFHAVKPLMVVCSSLLLHSSELHRLHFANMRLHFKCHLLSYLVN